MSKIIFVLSILLIVSCSKNSKYTVWDGPKVEFTKTADTDPEEMANQDKITPSVSITRGTMGGQIYNIELEDEFSKDTSPLGTEWAIGDISDISNLVFFPFRAAVGEPKQVEGKNLVLHIIEEDVYLSLKFTAWGESFSGSFSYERSTEN